MYTLKIQNARGELFELTHDSESYSIIGIQGLTTPQITVNTATAGGTDGEFFNSARMGMRNIVIDIVINGDIEANRKRLYRIFSLKKPCTVFFKNANRDVKISGYVELIDGDLFTPRQQMQVSIICPRPYWEGLAAINTELAHIMRRFSFPFSISESSPVPISSEEDIPTIEIFNDGDTECGLTMTLTFTGAVAVPVIHNSTTGEYFGLNGQYYPGSIIRISTVTGALSATLISGGTETNITGSMTQGSTWLKLAVGDNILSYTASNNADKMSVDIQAALLYGGV